jgi:amidase
VVVRNPDAVAEAEASDARRAAGHALGPLEGIPYTAKDSYLVRGLTAAAGSPPSPTSSRSATRSRSSGCARVARSAWGSRTCPRWRTGMQRGVYGRAESPYNADYLAAPFGSGSSNGSGTATAASFAAFGLGEETWSSGRGPASNSALCAYTPPGV